MDNKTLMELVDKGVINIIVRPSYNFNKYMGFDPEQPNAGNLYDLFSLINTSAQEANENPQQFIESLKREVLKEMEGYYRPQSESRNSKSVVGSVYLMRNKRNGHTKIGFTANEPTYREATLQSQEPEVTLIEYWQGTMKDESALHSLFARKRLRGEWFNLSKKDIASIGEYFEAREHEVV